MALSMTIQSDIGQEFKDAYVRIDEYSCSDNNVVNARIRAYVSREMKILGKAPISGSEDLITLVADYSDESANTKKQIYEYIKSEKYVDAIDILED